MNPRHFSSYLFKAYDFPYYNYSKDVNPSSTPREYGESLKRSKKKRKKVMRGK